MLVADIGLEAEFSRTISDGELNGDDIDVDTNAIYLTFVTPGAAYLKLRAGYIDSEVTIGNNSSSDDDTSFGAGIGLSTGILRFEIEFTQVNDDTDFLTLGVQF